MFGARRSVSTEVVRLASLNYLIQCEELNWVYVWTCWHPESFLGMPRPLSFGHLHSVRCRCSTASVIFGNYGFFTDFFLFFLLLLFLFAADHWVACCRDVVTDVAGWSVELPWWVVVLLKPHFALVLRLLLGLFNNLIVSLILHLYSGVDRLDKLGGLMLLLVLLGFKLLVDRLFGRLWFCRGCVRSAVIWLVLVTGGQIDFAGFWVNWTHIRQINLVIRVNPNRV